MFSNLGRFSEFESTLTPLIVNAAFSYFSSLSTSYPTFQLNVAAKVSAQENFQHSTFSFSKQHQVFRSLRQLKNKESKKRKPYFYLKHLIVLISSQTNY